MALRRPVSGWHSPVAPVAREASVITADFFGTQGSVNRCQARPDGGSSAARIQSPSSTRTSAFATPPSAQAQPQISIRWAAAMTASGAGATITDCGATAQTGAVRPLAGAGPSCTGSLYQRVVKGPGARSCASVMRVSHFTLLVP